MQGTVRRLLGATLALGALSAAAAADWPQFRGILRDGRSAETGLLRSWPAGGPREAWRRSLGQGYSGIAVAGGKLFTMYAEGGDEGQEYVTALDPATGQELWKSPVGKRIDTQFGNGPRATPTIDGDSVYVLGGGGTLMALAAKDGAMRWKLELTETFGSKVPTWGFSVSPVVEQGTVILEAGGSPGKSYAGIDAKDGKILWTSGDGPEEPGYMSALPVELAGTRQFVHVVGDSLRSVDGAGKLIWSHPWPRGETHATPVFVPPDRILVAGVDGVGAMMLRIAKGQEGAVVEEVWKSPTFRTHFNAAVLEGEHLYGFDNTTLKCISAADGSVAWARRGLGKGSLIGADGLLIVLADDGRLLLIEASPAELRETGSVQALAPEGGRTWTPPALSGGRVFLRNHAEIVAYDVKG
jgi:outer membrane protein assembly factor BamB